MTSTPFAPADVQALGWSLLHFLWQGAAAAAVLAGLNALCRRAAPLVRYRLAAAALLAMVLLPVATFRLVRGQAAPAGERAQAPGRAAAPAPPAAPAAFRPAQAPAPQRQRAVEPLLPWLVAAWAAGVALFSLRACGGWALAQRLKRSGVAIAAPRIQEAADRLARALRVSPPVRVCASALVRVPTVVGALRPLILLPASAATGLSAEQLEAILAHELAHVRRADALVNLLQTAAEALLFYHPAVWWVSERMRVEREHCCDDLAVEACGDPARYARALAQLEELRGGLPALALAASGGSLLARIARLAGRPLPRASRAPAALLAAAALAGAIGTASLLASARRGSTAVDDPLQGSWTAKRASQAGPGAAGAPLVQLGMRQVRARGESSHTMPVALAELVGLSEAQLDATAADVRFAWTRDAGSFAFEGRFLDGAGSGRFAFTPSEEYRADMARRGYAGIDDGKALSLAFIDVSRAFIDALAELGYTKVALDDLVAMRIHGASPEFIRALAAAGYPGLPVQTLVTFRIHGVSPEFVGRLQALGYAGLDADQLVTFRIHGVGPEFVERLQALGYAGLSPDQLVAFRIHGVSPEFVEQVKGLGYEPDAETLTRLRIHGVSADFIRRAQGRRGRTVGLDALVSMQIHGEQPD